MYEQYKYLLYSIYILVEQHSNKTTPIPRIQIETKPMEKVIV